jgi:hypothetical protein
MVELHQRHRPTTAVGAAPGPLPRPGKERLDVGGALQLVQPPHRAVVGGQAVAQHHDRLDPRVDAPGPQRGGQRLGVADDLSADLGLADLLGELGGAVGDRAGLAGRVASSPSW